MGKIVIKRAKPLDVVKVARLLYQAYDEQEGMYPEPNELMVLNWVTGIMNEGHILIAEKEGRVIGSIGISNYRFPWSEKWYLYVDWLFVSKGFREGGVFEALMTALHSLADMNKAPIFGGISSGKDARLKDRMMKMKGYTYLGGQFLRMEADDGQRVEKEQFKLDVQAERGD